MVFHSIVGGFRWMFLLHALGGGLALAVMVLPIVSRKGGQLHVKAGWVYTFAMLVVAASAFVITPWRGFVDPDATDASRRFALFLFFIAVLTLSSLSYGLQAVWCRKRVEPSRELRHVALPSLLGILAVIVMVVGLRSGDSLLMAFTVIGLSTARGQLRYWAQAPRTRMHWWHEHMDGMGTACIATVTAFLVTALPRLTTWDIARSPVLWIAPGVVFGTGLHFWKRSYSEKFGKATT